MNSLRRKQRWAIGIGLLLLAIAHGAVLYAAWSRLGVALAIVGGAGVVLFVVHYFIVSRRRRH